MTQVSIAVFLCFLESDAGLLAVDPPYCSSVQLSTVGRHSGSPPLMSPLPALARVGRSVARPGRGLEAVENGQKIYFVIFT